MMETKCAYLLPICRHMQQQVSGQLSSKWRDCQTALQSELKLISSLEKDKATLGTAKDTARLPANRSAQVCSKTDLAAVHSRSIDTASTCPHTRCACSLLSSVTHLPGRAVGQSQKKAFNQTSLYTW